MSLYSFMSPAIIVLRIEATNEIVKLKGQVAQFTRVALLAGKKGFTFGDANAALGGFHPNLKGIKDRLKKKGVQFRKERVPGQRYYRYWLAVVVEVISDEFDT